VIKNSKAFSPLKYPCTQEEKNSILLLSTLFNKISAGNKSSGTYHKIASMLIIDIFRNEFSLPKIEISIPNHRKRYDLMFYNKANSGFWSNMRDAHLITHVIFEIKNWAKNNNIAFLNQINRYSKSNRAIVLVTRREPDTELYEECSGIMQRVKNCLPLPISRDNIIYASQLKIKGENPNYIFEEAYLKLSLS
jgi:hypothetical protein